MAFSTESQSSDDIYITKVEGEGPFLKILGQLNRATAIGLENLIIQSQDDFDKGFGTATAASIAESLICCARFNDGVYYRARVLSTSNLPSDSIEVLSIDYGYKDVISLSAIRLLDNCDPMLLQTPSLLCEFILSRFMNKNSNTDADTKVKIDKLLCHTTYPPTYPYTMDNRTTPYPLISIIYSGKDLSEHLAAIDYGIAVTLEEQQTLLQQFVTDSTSPIPNWQRNYNRQPVPYNDHVLFLSKQNFPTNPASTMRLQQTGVVNFNRSHSSPAPPISQGLAATKNIIATRIGGQTPRPVTPSHWSSPVPIKKRRFLEINSQHTVYVSHVEKGPQLFAVQLESDKKLLEALIVTINKHPLHNLKEPTMIGTVCLSRHENKMARAIVTNWSADTCTLYFVDFGNTKTVQYFEMFHMPEEFVEQNVFAMRFCLSAVKSLSNVPNLAERFEQFVKNKVLTLKVVRSEGPPLVQYAELYLNKQSVYDLLLEMPNPMLDIKRMHMLQLNAMLVNVIDETESPPLDVAKRMLQLSQPRSFTQEPKQPPHHTDSSFSSPPSEDSKRTYHHVKSFKEEHRPLDDEMGHRTESFRGKDRESTFDRSVPGRHSEKFGSRQVREDRHGGPKPWENKSSLNRSGGEEWDDSAQPLSNQTNTQNRESHSGPNKREPVSAAEEDWDESPPHLSQNSQNRDRKPRMNQPDRSGQKPGWKAKTEDIGKRLSHTTLEPPASAPRGSVQDRLRRDNFNKRDEWEDNKSKNTESDHDDRTSFRPRNNYSQVQYKELTDPVPLETPFLETSVEPGAQREVSLTCIISPKDFHAQILSFQPQFLDMMHSIPELYKGVRPFSGNISVGASVLARYPEDGVLYRATVLAVQPFGKYIVEYIDFGNKSLVEAKDIWQLDKQLLEVPRMAVNCSLLGVAPIDGEWKENNDIDLCFNAPRYHCIFQECVGGVHKVSLWNDGISVADMLVEKSLAIAEQTSAITLKDEAIDLPIIIGQQMLCTIPHVESWDKFYIQLDLQKVAVVEKTMANFDVNLLTPLAEDSLYVDADCVVKHQEKIYRAKLVDVSDPTKIRAVLPDYGNTITVSVDNVMNLPTELSIYPYQSLECCFNNFSTESNKLMTLYQLKETLTGNKYIVYVNDVDGIRVMTTLYDVKSGKKVAIFEPDEGAYDEVVQLCTRAVYNYNFGMAYLAHIENLNDIYLQKSTDIDRIDNMLDELYTFYEEGTPEAAGDLYPEALCAAKSSDGNWYRATVVSVGQSDCKVQFSEYGNTETISMDNIKKLDPKFYEPCALALVASLGLTALQEDAITKLKAWIADKEVQVMLAFGPDGWLASLHLDGIDLSMKLVNEQLATTKVASDEGTKLDPVAEETAFPPSGRTKVYVSHIDSPSQFYLQMADKLDQIEEIRAELQANTETYPDIEYRETGTICVAKYSADDMWYRAEILDLDSDNTAVQYIDYGNADVLDNKPGLLKVMPDGLKAIDRLAVKSSVNAIPTRTGQWSEPASEYFTKLVGDISLPVDALIVGLKDTYTYVDLFVNGQNITDKLVSEGHATRSGKSEYGDWLSCFASHIN